jgi:cobalt/nickel transport protein
MNRLPHNRLWILAGLGIASAIAVFLSPFASSDPDGLDRVARDLEFEKQAAEHPISRYVPFSRVFEEYAVKGVPEAIATPLAGLAGTLVCFGLAWGIGKIFVPRAAEPPSDSEQP